MTLRQICHERKGIYRRTASKGIQFVLVLMAFHCISCSSIDENTICEGIVFGALVKDPKDCAVYYECSSPVIKYTCENGKIFDIELEECVIGSCFPEIESTTKPTPSKVPGTECSNEPYCKTTEDGTFHRDRKDCRKYYECKKGKAIPQKCNVGFYFDENIKACNYPSIVDCVPMTNEDCTPGPTDAPTTEPTTESATKSTTEITTESTTKSTTELTTESTTESTTKSTTESTTESTTGSTTQPTVPPSTTPADGNSKPIEECPPIPDCENKRESFYLDPRDCRKFYFCKNGKVVPQQCKPGESFDIKTNTCQYSPLVDCKSNPNCPTIPSTIDTIPNGLPDPSITDCRNLRNGSAFRDCFHCSVYYVCRRGQAIKRTCPYGQWFDNDKKFCNFREAVKNCPSLID